MNDTRKPQPRPDMPNPGQGGPVVSGQPTIVGPAPRPATKAEREAAEVAAWRTRWEATKNQNATQFLPQTAVFLTAWQSVPKPVRFAVWVWAITVIVGVAGAVAAALFWGVAIFAALSQM